MLELDFFSLQFSNKQLQGLIDKKSMYPEMRKPSKDILEPTGIEKRFS